MKQRQGRFGGIPTEKLEQQRYEMEKKAELQKAELADKKEERTLKYEQIKLEQQKLYLASERQKMEAEDQKQKAESDDKDKDIMRDRIRRKIFEQQSWRRGIFHVFMNINLCKLRVRTFPPQLLDMAKTHLMQNFQVRRLCSRQYYNKWW